MQITADLIQKLRAATGAGIMDAKKALQKADGVYEKAIDILRQHGQKLAAKKQERQTKNGVIGVYVHANHRLAGLVALACESDFVARTDEFKELAHELAMQVVAADPQYVKPQEVPAAVKAKEEAVYQEQLRQEGKPEKIWDKIILGKLQKFYSATCLLNQPFIKDDTKTIEQLIQEKILKLGENIQIKEFKRMAL